MIRGMAASLVNRPAMIKAAQKNSAKMTAAIEVGPPSPKGSAKPEDFEAKLTNFWYPCGIISAPSETRNSSSAMETEVSE